MYPVGGSAGRRLKTVSVDVGGFGVAAAVGGAAGGMLGVDSALENSVGEPIEIPDGATDCAAEQLVPSNATIMSATGSRACWAFRPVPDGRMRGILRARPYGGTAGLARRVDR